MQKFIEEGVDHRTGFKKCLISILWENKASKDTFFIRISQFKALKNINEFKLLIL